MVKKRLGLYWLADKVRDEAFIESQLQIAGGNQARILERLEKSKNETKRQALVLKIVYATLLGVVPILPLFMYFQVTGLLAGSMVPVEVLTFISVLLLVIYFGMVSMYLLILGVQSVSGFMSGDAFQWIEVLPVPRQDLQKVGFIVLWRTFDIPMIVVVAVFPTLMAVATGSVIVFFACLGASILNGFFLFCVIILIAEKFNRILKGGETNSRKASIVRVVAMLGAVIAMSSTGLVINVTIQSIGPIFASFASLENAGVVNLLFSLIPFPFATSFLVSFAILPPGTIPAPLILSTLVGVLILVVLLWQLYRRVLAKVRNITSYQSRTEPPHVKEPIGPAGPVTMRDIKPVTPVKAYIRKDLASLTRDFQGAMYLFMPIVYPFVIFIPASQGMRVITGVDLFIYVFLFLMMLTVMNAGMLVTGLLSMEDSGASIIASLPVIPRDQAMAKLKIICTVQLVSTLLPLVVFVGIPEFMPLVPFFLGYCLISIIIAMVMFAAKVRLFGKLRYKYVLDEANVERKALKWFAIICLDISILGGTLILAMLVGTALGTAGIMFVIVVVGGAGFVLAMYLLNRMFPKLPARKISSTLNG
jgi:hypothetical protein